MSVSINTVSNSQSFGVWLERTNQMISIIASNAVTADASTNGSITTGNSAVNGYFSANVMIVTGNLRGGNVSTANTLTVSSNVTFSANALMNANVTVNSSLTVLSNTTLANLVVTTAKVTGAANLTTVAVTGHSNLATVTVSGNATVSGALFTVTNNANVAGDLLVVGNLYVNGTTTYSGTTLANGDSIPVLNDTYKLGNTTNRFIVFSSNASVANTLSFSNVSVATTTNYSFPNSTIQTVDSFPIATYRSAEYLVQLANSTSHQVSKILGVHDGSAGYVTEYGMMLSNVSLGVFSATVSGGNFNLQCTPTSNTSIQAKIHRVVITV